MRSHGKPKRRYDDDDDDDDDDNNNNNNNNIKTDLKEIGCEVVEWIHQI
jgi:hypothetical protein